MTLDDRLERLATRTPPGTPAQVLAAARARASNGTAGDRSAAPRALVAAAVVAVVALAAGGLVAITGGDGESVVAGPDRDGRSGWVPTGTLRVENIQVVGNGPLVGGTERVVIDFSEPLPASEARYVADIASADPESGLAYTTQGPTSTHLCDSVHGVPAGGVGSVDLLIPANWFADDDAAHTVPELEQVDNPAKFPICGPHDGFIQYSMWSPLSADPADVTVMVAPDRTSLTIQVASEAGEMVLDPVAGQTVVAQFLGHLRAGDREAAAELWTGYPELGPDSTTADRLPYVEDLMADPTFTRILGSDTTTTSVTPATAAAMTAQVVTVLDARSGQSPPTAVAFLTELHDQRGGPGIMRIERLPVLDGTPPAPGLPADAYVTSGDAIVMAGVPVEGEARGFINGLEVPVAVDQESLTMTVVVPASANGDLGVTIVIATPELPDVRAFAVTVRP